MAEIKDSQLIRDALGSPVPQYWDEASQMYIARTVDGSFADVDFSKVRLLRDKLGSPIPQLWDIETAKFVPGKGGGNGEVTIESVPGLRSELDQTNATLAETVNKGFPLNVLGNLNNNIDEWQFDASDRLHMVMYGDSITAGAWGDPIELEWHKAGFVGRLHTLLRRAYGDGGRGFIGLWDKAWTKTGTWTSNADFGPWGSCVFASVSTANYVLNNIVGTTAEIYYINNAAMTFTYSVDGNAPVEVVATAPFNNQVSKASVNLGTLGVHTLKVNGPTVGNLFLVGASIYKGTNGVILHNLGRSSMTAHLGNYKKETRLDVMDAHFPPKLAFLNFLANDFVYQDNVNNALAAYENSLTALASMFKTSGSDLIIWQPPKGTKLPLANTWTREQYYEKSKAVAVANNAPWFDFWMAWGSDNASLMYDNEHPNAIGHKDIAMAFSRVLK